MDETTRRQITWVLIIAAILAVIIIASHRRGELARLATTIGEGTPGQRIAAVRTLIAKQKLMEALEDQPRWVQDKALAAITLIGTNDAYYELLTAHAMLDAPVQARDQAALTRLGQRGVEIFIEAIQDKDGVTRGTAKAPLTNVGKALEADDTLAHNPVIDGCMRLLDAWDQYVRDMVRDVLAAIATPRVSDKLVPVMQQTEPGTKMLPDGTIRDQTTQEFMRARGTAEATLIAMKVPAIQPIIDHLLTYRESAEVRGNAARVLGTIANQTNNNIPPADAVQVVAPLLDRLSNDEQWAVRRRAAGALGLLGAVSVEQGVVPRLITHLQDRDEVKAACVEALGRIGDQAAVEPLVNTLLTNRRGATSELRIALTALGAPAIPTVMRALAVPETEVRLIATQAIAEIGGPNAVVPLGSMLADNSVAVRRVAADALRGIADERVLPQVAAALGDEDWRVYHAARDALASVGGPAIPVLIEALGDEHPRVSSMAQQALVRIGETTLPALKTALTSPSEARSHWAAIAMGEIGYEAVDFALEVLRDRARPVTARAQAALALGRTGAGDAVEPLIVALRNQEPPVQTAAISALSRLADERATEALVSALLSRSERVRDAAMDVLPNWRLGDVEQELLKVTRADDLDAQRRATVLLAELTTMAAHELLEDVIAVGEVGRQRASVDLRILEATAGDPRAQSELRRRAIRALGYAGDTGNITALLELVKPGHEDAGPAALAVARIGSRATEEAAPGVRPELGPAGKALIDLLFATPDEDLRARVAAAISIMGDEPVRPLIQRLESAATSHELKLWTIATLGAVGKATTDPVLDERGRTRDAEYRSWLVSALPLVGDVQALDLIKHLPKEEQPKEEKVQPAREILEKIRAAGVR